MCDSSQNGFFQCFGRTLPIPSGSSWSSSRTTTSTTTTTTTTTSSTTTTTTNRRSLWHICCSTCWCMGLSLAQCSDQTYRAIFCSMKSRNTQKKWTGHLTLESLAKSAKIVGFQLWALTHLAANHFRSFCGPSYSGMYIPASTLHPTADSMCVKYYHGNRKSQLLIGSTSSNGCFFHSHLFVFGGFCFLIRHGLCW